MSPKDARITEIISEFSEIFTFARTRWARYAEGVHPELRGVGLMVLQLILKKGPVTATEISQMLDMDKATVSRQVANLREMDLVVAEPAAEDKRVTLLTPSPLAQEQFVKIRIAWAESYHERFSDWSMDDLEVLKLGLHRFNTASTDPAVDGPAARCSREQNHGLEAPPRSEPDAPAA
ncbi:winged helix-turn-helix transcriptional regulator [Leucobacter sp. CSA2]|uniref:Winged helix-turn-helix transcriptional regulator n=1 Tax=Leucobacter edaphi TaxID=2796472 RepID=A0A934UXJ1_9MICO|nr:winged helix-turn-helix transcriptional regulator [Leucobacter edaphi]